MFKVDNKIDKKEEFIIPKLTAKRKANELIEKNNDMSCKFFNDNGEETKGIILGISSKGEYVIGY